MSDYKGAALMLDAFPKANVLLGDRGYCFATRPALRGLRHWRRRSPSSLSPGHLRSHPARRPIGRG